MYVIHNYSSIDYHFSNECKRDFTLILSSDHSLSYISQEIYLKKISIEYTVYLSILYVHLSVSWCVRACAWDTKRKTETENMSRWHWK